MQNQTISLKNDDNNVSLLDAMDHASRLKGAIGYIADNTDDNQLHSLLKTIEESAEMLESLIHYLLMMQRTEQKTEKGETPDH